MAKNGKERAACFRERRRAGDVVVTIGIQPSTRRALVRLGLVPNGRDQDKFALALAAERFLTTAPGVVGVGDALYPEPPAPSKA
jgi:hypothetical protein